LINEVLLSTCQFFQHQNNANYGLLGHPITYGERETHGKRGLQKYL